ncbi:hypothetical protein ACRRTK_023608 [Alexandromys fortis]
MVTACGSHWASSGLHYCGKGVCSDPGWTHSSKMACSPAAPPRPQSKIRCFSVVWGPGCQRPSGAPSGRRRDPWRNPP